MQSRFRLHALQAALLAGLMLSASPALAGPDFQPVADIQAAAESQARQLADGDDVVVHAVGLDARLRLPLCRSALESFAPVGMRPGRNMTVGVRCPETGSWSLYVPVTLSISRQVVVAAQTLRSGDTLTAATLSLSERDISSLPYGYYQHVDAVVGQVLKRSISANQVIVPSALTRAKLISRGQSVTLLNRLGGIEIRARGRALVDGAANERIQVRNDSSGRIIEGIVKSADIVEVAGS